MQEAEGTSLQPGTLPELPLPALDSNSTKVLLGARPQPPQGKMSLVLRKPVFGVSDQVPHKPGCTVTEDG